MSSPPPPPSSSSSPSTGSKVGEYWQEKYRKEASKNWNLFYKRNQTRFFKDRHWMEREFPELFTLEAKTILEVGCGVGNFALPYSELVASNVTIYACDFAETAVELLKADERYKSGKLTAFVADITRADWMQQAKEQKIQNLSLQDQPPQKQLIPDGSVDIVTMIFVLSAIPPEKFHQAINNIKKILKPGGIVLFRDYSQDDAAQTRFKDDRKLSDTLFVRQDGTLAYYFNEIELKDLFSEVGFETIACDIVHSKTTNVKKAIDVDRLFIQAKFINK